MISNSRIQLGRASTAVSGLLVQLDYLQELTGSLSMTAKQRLAITQQIHNIKVNSAGAVAMIEAAKVIPLIGSTV